MIPADVSVYMSSVCSDDMIEEISHSFNLFEVYGIVDYEYEFSNILMLNDDRSIDDTRDNFFILINKKLDFIINEHKIKLNSDANINKKNEILDALYLYQSLESYFDILVILESKTGDDEKLADILSQLCNLSPTDILSILDEIDSDLITLMTEYANSKEETKNNKSILDNKEINSMINKIKLFKEFSGDFISVGILLINANIIIGLPLKDYLNYLNGVFNNKSVKEYAYHIYSIMLITSDYHENPIIGYRENSSLFFNDTKEISSIDIELNKLIANFDKFLIDKKIGA